MQAFANGQDISKEGEDFRLEDIIDEDLDEDLDEDAEDTE
jgi:hypothetical protein